MSYAAAHLGARVQYAVARLLHEAGELHRLFAGVHSGKGWLQFNDVSSQGRRFSDLRKFVSRASRGMIAPIRDNAAIVDTVTRLGNSCSYRSTWRRPLPAGPSASILPSMAADY